MGDDDGFVWCATCHREITDVANEAICADCGEILCRQCACFNGSMVVCECCRDKIKDALLKSCKLLEEK